MTTQLFLCLACSSSPSPRLRSLAPFTTACCARPICETCLTKNPRLRGYNPCLVCLAGTAVVDRSRTCNVSGETCFTVPGPSGRSQEQESSMFVLVDSDDEEGGPELTASAAAPALPIHCDESEASEGSEASEVLTAVDDDKTLVTDPVNQATSEADGSGTSRYYIQRSDTLMGIALRYGIDGRTICQLNSLPLSTLSTTPHVLHTRTSLVLPLTHHPLPPPPDREVLEARTRERAEKRFQVVTKEVDWRVAKAYVSLAEDEDEMALSKEHMEYAKHAGRSVLEARAVDQYLDDVEWEARQESSGCPRIREFPPFTVVKDKTIARKTPTSKRINS